MLQIVAELSQKARNLGKPVNAFNLTGIAPATKPSP